MKDKLIIIENYKNKFVKKNKKLKNKNKMHKQ